MQQKINGEEGLDRRLWDRGWHCWWQRRRPRRREHDGWVRIDIGSGHQWEMMEWGGVWVEVSDLDFGLELGVFDYYILTKDERRRRRRKKKLRKIMDRKLT